MSERERVLNNLAWALNFMRNYEKKQEKANLEEQTKLEAWKRQLFKQLREDLYHK